MKKLFKISGLVAVLVLVLTGCGGQAVYNIQNAPIEVQKGTSVDTVYKAIKKAGYQRGWRVSKVSPGVAKAYIDVRGKHQATVLISYNASEYSIEYKNSSNLKYNAENHTIHKSYNSWVKNLDRDIQFQLSTLSE